MRWLDGTRWVARTTAVLAILFVLLFLVGEGLTVNGVWPTPDEWIGLLFFPFGMVLGYILAFSWERAGGLLGVISFVAFYLWNYYARGRFPTGIYFPLLAVPGVLFLICSWWPQADERQPRIA